MVDVVTVFTPRGPLAKWEHYLPLLKVQRETAQHFGHLHRVVSDTDIPGFDVFKADLEPGLMPSMIRGVIAWLSSGASNDTVFVDVDCLIGRDLKQAFAGDEMFDLRLTRRDNKKSPINNGAMYVRWQGIDRARFFFERAFDMCGEHWGADQEAISMACNPVPDTPSMAVRHYCTIKFEHMKPYNVVPKEKGISHNCKPFVVHFKGATKDWMVEYAERYILNSMQITSTQESSAKGMAKSGSAIG